MEDARGFSIDIPQRVTIIAGNSFANYFQQLINSWLYQTE